jgi:phosphoribosylaminoimidazolecarboxamide formyltransferase/IMP cyclohydrolase
VDPADYDRVLDDMDNLEGATSLETRRDLAGIAYRRTAAYDAAIGGYFAALTENPFPERLTITASRGQILRYGENPHQEAAIYLTEPARPGIARARQIQGKELSYNNLNDTDAALDLLSELPLTRPSVVIVKHANPCGVATGADLVEAYQRAFDCDRTSAFGGIIAVNRPLDGPTAEAITEIFTEVIAAPAADADARKIIAAKKNLRLLLLDTFPDPANTGFVIKSIQGGLLVQTRDNGRIGLGDFKVVTKRAPSEREMEDMLFAFRVAKHVKSNAIVYAKDGATVGIGAGQMSRVDASRIAAVKAQDVAIAQSLPQSLTIGSVVASDAFLPFADGLEAAIAAGATAMIQPGGSIRDDEVIAAADAAGLAMVFTGMRHFRH